ncbi:hypothetical protein EON63_11415, partial [archaeon]
TIYHIPYTIYHTPYTIHHTPYTIYHTPYTIHHTPYTIHHTPYTIYHIPYTIHHTPYTIHHIPYIIYHYLGRYKYQPNQHKRIGMIAGGTGLTPCLQVTRTVLEGEGDGDATCFTLFFQNRCEKDILLQDELDSLVEKYPTRITIIYFLSNAQNRRWGSKGEEDEVRGYITSTHISSHMSPAACTQVCVCGPSGFNEYVNGLLMDAGHTKDTVFVW